MTNSKEWLKIIPPSPLTYLPNDDTSPVIVSNTETGNGHNGDDSQSAAYTENERIARDKVNIIQALELCDNKISGAGGAAELLGIKPTTLASRLKIWIYEFKSKFT